VLYSQLWLYFVVPLLALSSRHSQMRISQLLYISAPSFPPFLSYALSLTDR